MTKGIDYAWSKPSASWIKSQGYGFAMRYLSRDSSKDLSLGEANSLASYGIWMGVVWETSARRARDGYAAGRVDAARALAAARELEMPEDRPIYFAVDYDASTSEVVGYFQGVVSYMGLARTGVYGGYNVVKGLDSAGLATWFWQTLAWSGGRWYAGNHIEQYEVGVSWDENRSKQDDFGQWMPGKSYTEEINMEAKDLAKAVWETDGVCNSPASRQAAGNLYWAAKSYLREIYQQNEQILAGQASLATELAAIKAALANPAAVSAEAVVDELAQRLTPPPPAPPTA
jgi:hypothetical protein